MKKHYLGVDVGSISTKGVIIDEERQVVANTYIWTDGNPMRAVKNVVKDLLGQFKDEAPTIYGVGTTGSARKLVGIMLGATTVKNEITAHAIGTLNAHPDVRTILEIGGQDSKIILLKNGIVTDYAMNTLCAAGTGAFLTSQAKRLDLKVEDFGDIALSSKTPAKLAARCTVFAESDLVHKIQTGAKKEDIVAGLCNAVVDNYLNNVGKGKKIEPKIVFQGGVSKNKGVVAAFEKALGHEVIVDDYGHLMGAIGIAVLARRNKVEKIFAAAALEGMTFETKAIECPKCPNYCEIIAVFKGKELIDSFGNRCENGALKVKQTG